jgi:hypothetical protein
MKGRLTFCFLDKFLLFHSKASMWRWVTKFVARVLATHVFEESFWFQIQPAKQATPAISS